jgi:hypothetical protein
LLLGALEKASDAGPSLPVSRRDVLRALVDLYEAWGRTEDAERYRAMLR